jgi:AraC-like DNA-binding protein
MYIRETHIVGARTRERIVHPAQCAALRQRGIRLTGLSDARPGFRFVRHRPGMIQILACYAGRGRVWIDGRWQSCEAGQAYITPAEAFHAYHAAGRWRVGWVIYAPSESAPAASAPALARVNVEPFRDAINGLYREMVGPGDPAVAQHWAELIDAMARRMAGPGGSVDRLAGVWEAVDADPARPWTLEDMASLADVSTEHLRRLCRARHGRTPMRRVTHLRMQRALGLLAGTDRSIESIARDVGYENAFAFSTAFRRWMGAPPSSLRRKNV